jgi:hypothetical protein
MKHEHFFVDVPTSSLQTNQAPVFGNLSSNPNLASIPFKESNFDIYFVSPYRTEIDDPVFIWWYLTGAISHHYIRAMVLFAPRSIAGKLIPLVLTVGIIYYLCTNLTTAADQSARDGFYNVRSLELINAVVIISLLVSPLVPVTCYVSTKTPGAKYARAYVLFLLLNAFEMTIGLLYSWYVMPIFFATSTSEFVRIFLRIIVQSGLYILSIEVCWVASYYSQTMFGCRSHHSHILFSFNAAFLTFMARMMQGSASTPWQAVLFEATGTCCELMTADTLLRGETPVTDTKQMSQKAVKAARRRFSSDHGSIDHVSEEREEGLEGAGISRNNSSNNSLAASCDDAVDSDAVDGIDAAWSGTVDVHSNSSVVPSDNMHPAFAPTSNSADLRREFCSSALIMLSIAECANIFVASSYYIFVPSNPGAPGSPKIQISQSLLNLLIMLVGELVITDGLIAYLARHFNRYCNDPADEWGNFKENRSILVGIILVIATVNSSTILQFAGNFCSTSWLEVGDDDRDFVLTSCPAAPRNVTEMLRVGETFVELLEKHANNNDNNHN